MSSISAQPYFDFLEATNNFKVINLTIMALYRPLDELIHEIRVLHILPGRSAADSSQSPEQVECRLEYKSLDDSPTYHALSYTWQLPESDVPLADREPVDLNEDGGVDILLDGHVVSVTYSLWSALKHFRWFPSMEPSLTVFPNDTRLWVDALCINQHDLPERSSQVRQMRQIYEKADYVNIWLGPETQDMDLALPILQGFTKEMVRISKSKRRRLKVWIARWLGHEAPSNSPLLHTWNEWLSKTLRDSRCGPAWIALAAIYRKSYWNRVWTLQEMLNNARVSVHCGNFCIDLDDVLFLGFTAAEMCDKNRHVWQNSSNAVQDFLNSSSWAWYRLRAREKYVTPETPGLTFARLLFYYHTQQSTDPRDMVYALLGLLPQPPSHDQLAVDYTLPTAEVYEAATRYEMKTTKKLALLWQAGSMICDCSEDAHLSLSALPSWTPDWSCKTQWGNQVFELSRDMHQYPDIAGDPCSVTFSTVDKAMTCVGFEFGLISQICHDTEPRDYGFPLRRLKEVIEFTVCNLCVLGPEARAMENESIFLTLYESICLTKFDSRVQPWLPKSRFLDLCRKLVEAGRSGQLDLDDTWLPALQTLWGCLNLRSWFSCVVEGAGQLAGSVLLGICIPSSRLQDKIVILRGCQFPVLLREREEMPGTYTYIKEVYVHGYMQGEAVGKVEERSFEIY